MAFILTFLYFLVSPFLLITPKPINKKINTVVINLKNGYSNDTTNVNCEKVYGNELKDARQVFKDECYEITATDAIDLTDGFDAQAGSSFDAKIGNIIGRINTYAIPKYGQGVVSLDYNGKVTETILNLEIVSDVNGDYWLRDLAYDSKLRISDTSPYVKRYLIGYSDKYNPLATTFSQEQMKQGININAYKGREITIMAFMQGKSYVWEAKGAYQQSIYVPDKNYQASKTVGNITYYYAPPTRIFKESQIHYFEEYIPKINLSNGDLLGILATTKNEETSPSWQEKNIFSKIGPDNQNKCIVYLGDHFVDNIPSNGVVHPGAYQRLEDGNLDLPAWNLWFDAALKAAGSMEQFRKNTIEAFVSTITRPFGTKHRVVFVNNEVWSYWEKGGYRGALFESWIKDAYTEHTRITGNEAVPWSKNIYNYKHIISDEGYGDPDKIMEGTYRDLTYNSGGNFENFKNWIGKYGTISASHKQEWGASMNDGGGYSNNFYNYELTYRYIYTGLMSQQHNYPKKTAYIHWHEVEPAYDEFIQTDKWVRFKDKTYRVPAKQIPGAETMFTLGAAAAFFNPAGKGGYVVWSDPLTWSNKEDATHIYPYVDLYEVRQNGDTKVKLGAGKYNYPVAPTTFINQVVDAYYIIKEHRTILENSIAKIADVNMDGIWYSGQDKYPFAAAYNKHPFVSYRRYGNEILVFAYAWYNHAVTNTTFRLDTGEVISVELKGCYPTIAKVNLASR